ncbi:MAG TPA: hypothetical protein VFK50_12195 [Sphingomicrobium sp.]|nr:hypothetical protein [Sphingomicrobium sp.]
MLTTAPAMAQNSATTADNQVAATATHKAETAKTKKGVKPAGDKICKRLPQGKVCMTAEKWKAYEEQF